MGFVLVIAGPFGWAQEGLSLLLEPRVSFNDPVTATYSHNFSIAQRVLYLNLGEEEVATRKEDLSHFSRVNRGVNFVNRVQSLRFGYPLRV